MVVRVVWVGISNLGYTGGRTGLGCILLHLGHLMGERILVLLVLVLELGIVITHLIIH